MKITSTTAATFLLFLAACRPAAAQADVNPDHFADGSSAEISASNREAQIRTLQEQLEGGERQLRAKAERVENARQEAISAGILGDGAGSFIDAYQQEQKELEVLQAALTPQIERMRNMIANLTVPGLPSNSPSSAKTAPARQARTVAAPGNSRGSEQDKRQSIASNNASKFNPVAR